MYEVPPRVFPFTFSFGNIDFRILRQILPRNKYFPQNQHENRTAVQLDIDYYVIFISLNLSKIVMEMSAL